MPIPFLTSRVERGLTPLGARRGDCVDTRDFQRTSKATMVIKTGYWMLVEMTATIRLTLTTASLGRRNPTLATLHPPFEHSVDMFVEPAFLRLN